MRNKKCLKFIGADKLQHYSFHVNAREFRQNISVPLEKGSSWIVEVVEWSNRAENYDEKKHIYSLIFKNILYYISPFCGATGTPFLEFW